MLCHLQPLITLWVCKLSMRVENFVKSNLKRLFGFKDPQKDMVLGVALCNSHQNFAFKEYTIIFRKFDQN